MPSKKYCRGFFKHQQLINIRHLITVSNVSEFSTFFYFTVFRGVYFIICNDSIESPNFNQELYNPLLNKEI